MVDGSHKVHEHTHELLLTGQAPRGLQAAKHSLVGLPKFRFLGHGLVYLDKFQVRPYEFGRSS